MCPGTQLLVMLHPFLSGVLLKEAIVQNRVEFITRILDQVQKYILWVGTGDWGVSRFSFLKAFLIKNNH